MENRSNGLSIKRCSGATVCSGPDVDGLMDNRLSRTDLQISGFAFPHGKLSLAPMFIALCCMAGVMEVRPEQAWVIETSTNANATIDAAMMESFFSMFDPASA